MSGHGFLRGAFCALVISALPGAGIAGEAWDDISGMLFEGRDIQADAGAIDLMVPYRATDDTRTRMGARIALPGGEAIKKSI
jgi:hypothetical protein